MGFVVGWVKLKFYLTELVSGYRRAERLRVGGSEHRGVAGQTDGRQEEAERQRTRVSQLDDVVMSHSSSLMIRAYLNMLGILRYRALGILYH